MHVERYASPLHRTITLCSTGGRLQGTHPLLHAQNWSANDPASLVLPLLVLAQTKTRAHSHRDPTPGRDTTTRLPP